MVAHTTSTEHGILDWWQWDAAGKVQPDDVYARPVSSLSADLSLMGMRPNRDNVILQTGGFPLASTCHFSSFFGSPIVLAQ